MKLPLKVGSDKAAMMRSYEGRRVLFGKSIIHFISFTFEKKVVTKRKKEIVEIYLTEYKAIGWSPRHKWFFDFDLYDLWRTFGFFDTSVLMDDYFGVIEQLEKLNERLPE